MKEFVPKAPRLEDEFEDFGFGDEDAEGIVNRHIKLLHEYNEAKDATQVSIYYANCLILDA